MIPTTQRIQLPIVRIGQVLLPLLATTGTKLQNRDWTIKGEFDISVKDES